jgi:3-oxoacyl-[acyl-carrier protein] reductase
MNSRFQNQVAIVTGGASGIGEGIARRLARERADVAIFDRLGEELLKTTKAMQQEGLAVEGHQVDIAAESQVIQAVQAVYNRKERIDIMVNSAGVVGPTATNIEDYETEDFRKVVDVNLSGAFLMTKHTLTYMTRRDYGRILLISSIGGKEGNPGMSGYAASKSGVMGLVKGVGKEYAKTGITINGLAPAVIATPMNLETAPELLKYMADKIPMGRLGTIDEATAIACWIVSQEASFNTGFVFDLSGGRATY